jgi:pimeloyl-ACP methyl ester carboxylesterase
MRHFLVAIAIAVLALYLAACLGLFVGQRSLIYYPPQQAQVAAPRSWTFDAPGAVLKVSERPAAGNKAVLYLGGNAEDVSASLPLLARAFPDHAIYLLHYRGYTGSSGSPTEAAFVSDALALLDRVAARHGEIVLIGRSLGTGVAVQVAGRRPVHRLVLVTPFDSLQELAAQQFPLLPVRWLLKDKYESWRYAPQVRAPTLIVAAERDEIIPAWSTRKLLSRFTPGIVTMETIAGAGHNTVSESPAYLAALRRAN